MRILRGKESVKELELCDLEAFRDYDHRARGEYGRVGDGGSRGNGGGNSSRGGDNRDRSARDFEREDYSTWESDGNLNIKLPDSVITATPYDPVRDGELSKHGHDDSGHNNSNSNNSNESEKDSLEKKAVEFFNKVNKDIREELSLLEKKAIEKTKEIQEKTERSLELIKAEYHKAIIDLGVSLNKGKKISKSILDRAFNNIGSLGGVSFGENIEIIVQDLKYVKIYQGIGSSKSFGGNGLSLNGSISGLDTAYSDSNEVEDTGYSITSSVSKNSVTMGLKNNITGVEKYTRVEIDTDELKKTNQAIENVLSKAVGTTKSQVATTTSKIKELVTARNVGIVAAVTAGILFGPEIIVALGTFKATEAGLAAVIAGGIIVKNKYDIGKTKPLDNKRRRSRRSVLSDSPTTQNSELIFNQIDSSEKKANYFEMGKPLENLVNRTIEINSTQGESENLILSYTYNKEDISKQIKRYENDSFEDSLYNRNNNYFYYAEEVFEEGSEIEILDEYKINCKSHKEVEAVWVYGELDDQGALQVLGQYIGADLILRRKVLSNDIPTKYAAKEDLQSYLSENILKENSIIWRGNKMTYFSGRNNNINEYKVLNASTSKININDLKKININLDTSYFDKAINISKNIVFNVEYEKESMTIIANHSMNNTYLGMTIDTKNKSNYTIKTLTKFAIHTLSNSITETKKESQEVANNILKNKFIDKIISARNQTKNLRKTNNSLDLLKKYKINYYNDNSLVMKKVDINRGNQKSIISIGKYAG